MLDVWCSSRVSHKRWLVCVAADPKHIVETFEAEYDMAVSDHEASVNKPHWVEDLELLEMAPKEKSAEEQQREQLMNRGSAWSGRGTLDVTDFKLKAVDESDSEADD